MHTLFCTSALTDLSTWPKEFKYAYAHLHIYKSKPTHRSYEHTRSHTPTCTQSLFPFFCLYAEAEPVQPWCHWWGHCLGHQQHTDVPPRTSGNYEVMDQHTLTPPSTHTHIHTSSICSSSWFLGHLTELSISRSSGSLRKLTPCSCCKINFRVFGWSVRWKITTRHSRDTSAAHLGEKKVISTCRCPCGQVNWNLSNGSVEKRLHCLVLKNKIRAFLIQIPIIISWSNIGISR